MGSILIIGLAIVVLVGVVLVVVGVLRGRKPTPIEERLEEFAALGQPMTLEELELSQPFTERVVLPVIWKISETVTRFAPTRTLEATQEKLDLAGNPNNWGPRQFLGIRLLAALLLGTLGFAGLIFARSASFSLRLLLVAAALGLGYYLPVLWLGGRISRRKSEITKSLPDALDLLTICVEAGLGFDAAMSKLVEKWDDELNRAFARVLQEVQLGKLRREALRDMADRVDVPDVTSFAAAIIQADQLGVSIARVLRIQADQMRIRRRQRAEELARSATIKMLPAIAFLIFPAIFIVLLGPAVITFITLDVDLGLGF
jgi:tight adherence protein C